MEHAPDRMAASAASPGSQADAVLRWLVPLRFVSAAGQALALVAAAELRELPLPYAALWQAPLLTLASNLALATPWTQRRVPALRLVTAALLLDCVLFTWLLYWSGGPDNPFSALYVILVAMAAMTGSVAATWATALATAAGYATVFRWHEMAHFWHAPLADGMSVGLHAVGMWVAVTVVAVAITFFLNRIMRTLRDREAEMRRLGDIASRNARLASLTTLAAGAAHELGSPLGTIAVIARDLEREGERDGALASLGEDARLLRSEVERCRSILDRMRARAAHEQSGPLDSLEARDAEAALTAGLDEDEAKRLEIALDVAPATVLGARADFIELVAPIVRNALDASDPAAPVHVRITQENEHVHVVVRDHGHGMDDATLARVGEPFFTTRVPGAGTGLGLFVVNLHIERLGGSLDLASDAGEGTVATVRWPVDAAAVGAAGDVGGI